MCLSSEIVMSSTTRCPREDSNLRHTVGNAFLFGFGKGIARRVGLPMAPVLRWSGADDLGEGQLVAGDPVSV